MLAFGNEIEEYYRYWTVLLDTVFAIIFVADAVAYYFLTEKDPETLKLQRMRTKKLAKVVVYNVIPVVTTIPFDWVHKYNTHHTAMVFFIRLIPVIRLLRAGIIFCRYICYFSFTFHFSWYYIVN